MRGAPALVVGLVVGLSAVVAALAAQQGGAKSGREQIQRSAAGARPPPVRARPPRPYRLPSGAVRVSTANGLRGALRVSRPTAIVLAPGIYGGESPFRNVHGHRLYALRPGRSVLRAGLSMGGNEGVGGGLVRGLVFAVEDPDLGVEGAALTIWGSGRGSRVLDSVFRGSRRMRAGLIVRQPEGLVVRRVAIRGYTDYGVLIDANQRPAQTSTAGFRLEDAEVADIGRREAGSSEGRAEACVWIGHTGTVRRVHARSCAWTGLWTGTAAYNARFDRIDVDRSPIGVYVEHETTTSVFRRLRIGRRVRLGLLTEWASPEWQGKPASVDNTIEESWFESSLVGVYFDEGTTRTAVLGSTFANQSWAAIGDYRGRSNVFSDNDYRGIDKGAATISRDHLGAARDRGR